MRRELAGTAYSFAPPLGDVLRCDCGNVMQRDENAARNLFAYREELGSAGVSDTTTCSTSYSYNGS